MTTQQPTEEQILRVLALVDSPEWQHPRVHRYDEYYAAMHVLAAALAASRRDSARLDALNNPQIACQVYWSHEREAWVHSVSVTSEQFYDTVQEAIDAAAKGVAE